MLGVILVPIMTETQITTFETCTPDYYTQAGKMCVKELTKAPVSSLKLIGVLLFLMSMFTIHFIDLVNFLCDTFNEQTVASLVRVVTDLLHLLFSCFAHVW